MNCAVHSDVEATGFCRNCGKALCPACTREVRGALYCENCLAGMLSGGSPPPPRSARRVRLLALNPAPLPIPVLPACWDLFPAWEPCTTASI